MIQESFQELYSAKTDEELLALAADSVSLREDAKSVLAQELQRRNLEQPPSQQAGHQLGGEAESRAIPRALKAGAFLSMNVIIAVFAPAAIDVSVRNGIPLHSTSALVWEEYLISLICASGLGFGAWRKWRNPLTIWTWVVPAAWFAFGFLVVAGHGPFSGHLFAPRSESVLYDDSIRTFFRTFYAFTVPLIRGFCYSLGAYLSALLMSRRSAAIPTEPVVRLKVNE